MNNFDQQPFEHAQSPEDIVRIDFHTRREERYSSLMGARQAQNNLYPPVAPVSPIQETIDNTASVIDRGEDSDASTTLQELRYQTERAYDYDDTQKAA